MYHHAAFVNIHARVPDAGAVRDEAAGYSSMVGMGAGRALSMRSLVQ